MRSNLLIARLSFLILISSSIHNSFAQREIEPDKNILRLKGKIKDLVETSSYAKESNGQLEIGKLIYQDSYLFHEQGHLLESTHSNAEGLLWKDLNQYDERGNRIEEARYRADGGLIWKNTYRFNDLGNQLEKKAYSNTANLDFTITSSYDENGNLLTQYRSGPIGKKRTIVKNEYDSKGRLIEETTYDILNRPVKIYYKYDDLGNKIELQLFNSKGKLEEKQSFRYDQNGDLSENSIYNSPDFSPRKTLFVFNDEGDLLEKSRYQADGQLLEKDSYEFVYDSISNLIEEKHFKFYIGTKESYETYKYLDFDKNGNWQKKLTFKNGNLQSIIERTINYYLQLDQ